MDNSDLTWRKNETYRDGFRTMMRIANIEAAIILILCVLFFLYVKTSHRGDAYFATTAEGRRMEMYSLERPNLETNALSNWVAQASTQIMTFGFNDIDQRFALSRQNFTPQGWESFSKAMGKSKIIDAVLQTQQLITSVPLEPPRLVQEGLVLGKYNWIFEMRMLITFRSGSAQKVTDKNLRVVLEPVPTADNPNGIGISEWYIY